MSSANEQRAESEQQENTENISVIDSEKQCDAAQDVAEEAAEEGEHSAEDQTESAAWEREREELVNQILRLRADFTNYKRRNQELVDNIRLTANESLINEILPVIDHFELALASATEDTSFVTGVKMIFQQLMDCLEKAGLQGINAVGKPFDPNFHEAVSIEGDNNNNLIVTAELKKGYLFKGKLLRESMVQVGPEQQEEDEE